MFEFIQNIDEKLLFLLNGNNSIFMDAFMWTISDKFIAIPLYLFLIYLFFNKFGAKAWIPLILMIVSVGLADFISVHAFKEVFQRPRPCHNPEINNLIHSVYNKCGGQYGFVSSHASNNFALATIFYLLSKPSFKGVHLLLFFWAAIVSVSRVYLGVHYPSDIFFGALLGVLISYILFYIYKKLVKI